MENRPMIYIGCHLSVTDGYEAMGETMSRFGGNTFAWFTRNPRGGRTKPVMPEDVEALRAHMEQENFGPLVAHGSYTMNLCSAKEEIRANGRDILQQDLQRMELLPGNLYNFHPGSHKDRHEKLGQGCIGMEAMKRIVLHPVLRGLPFILETPNEDDGYIEEIRAVKSWMTMC